MSVGRMSGDESRTRACRGFAAGASVFLTRASRGGLQLEVLIQEKGAKGYVFRDDDPDDIITFTYLEVPLLLHVHVIQKGDRALYVVAGPSVAYSLRERYAYYRTSYNGIPLDDEFVNKLDVGVSTGLGVEYRALIVDARYTWGLRDASVPEGLKHRTFAVTAGVRFRR